MNAIQDGTVLKPGSLDVTIVNHAFSLVLPFIAPLPANSGLTTGIFEYLSDLDIDPGPVILISILIFTAMLQGTKFGNEAV